MKKRTVPVTARAMTQRINRALAPNEQLKATRGARAQTELGAYYIVDVRRNAITRSRIDLEELAKELGVLQPYERLEG